MCDLACRDNQSQKIAGCGCANVLLDQYQVVSGAHHAGG